MMGFRRLLAGATSLIAVLAFAAPAAAIDLTGVWATDAGLCGKVFTKKANRVAFAELSDLYGSGFIIEASRIRGKIAKCTIKSRKEDGARVHLSAACSTSVAVESVEFDLKIVDDNTITRVTPGSTGMDVSYHRCTL
jgi:hypothetical protein